MSAEATDTEELYERKKLELKALLGGDIEGRSVYDTQLPDGTFPIPCPQFDYDRTIVETENGLAQSLYYERVITYISEADRFTSRVRNDISTTPEAYITQYDLPYPPHMGPLQDVTEGEMDVYHRMLKEIQNGGGGNNAQDRQVWGKTAQQHRRLTPMRPWDLDERRN
eukprot:TRINITY_DN31487_c0_g1_i1.p1 TRINITY_DN31487_c0_g1~~TRINITY_DN31487_c0_g1_i1.p1  ORF type:complete len:179 (+),score=44.08 TRINITY_DN31487_c0_g1_i1:36-539(+)